VHLKGSFQAMTRPDMDMLDQYAECASGAWGIELPERLLWEGFVMRQDISHPPGWETGRPSEPAFMDLNLHAVRERGEPSTCIWQYDAGDPMNPRGLLIAYEEDEVKPVASDLDAFLIGSRGVDFEPLPDDQCELVRWLFKNIEGVLADPQPAGWTKRWLEVLKKEGAAGFHPELPKYGFGDPTSYDIMAKAVHRLGLSGAVRHGAECFNFYFPQELDEEFLVVWEGFPSVPWQYLSQSQLKEFLLMRVPDGYSFPLNPKWLLCDEGWWDVFTALQQSEAAKTALDAWFPGDLRERMAAVRAAYPRVFAPQQTASQPVENIEPDKAEWELSRFFALQRAKVKLRALHRMRQAADPSSRQPRPTQADEAEPEAPAAPEAPPDAATGSSPPATPEVPP